MAVTKTEIFISSRFEEFSELRKELRQLINTYPVIPLEAVDLNDGMANQHPPIDRCIDAVLRSEVMILLVGETYGDPPKGEKLSYTHLEHKAALAEDSDTAIIPFCIGQSYKSKLATFSNDQRLAEWQKEIKERHTPAFYYSNESPEVLARIIFDSALKVLHEARSQEVKAQMAQFELEWDEEDAEVGNLSFDELTDLGRLFSDEENQEDEEKPKSYLEQVHEMVANPSKTAALEQQKDALVALDYGDRKGAIYHYKRSLEFDPWNFEICYGLSRLLVSSSDKPEIRDALKLARRAVKIADKSDDPEKDTYISAAYVIAAQASAKLDDLDEGLKYSELACDFSPRFASAKAELACQYAHKGNTSKVIEIADDVFRMRYQTAIKLDREPAIQALGQEYQDYRKKRLEKTRDAVRKIVESEEVLLDRNPVFLAVDEVLDTKNKIHSYPMFMLMRKGQSAARRSLKCLQGEAKKIAGDYRYLEQISRKVKDYLRLSQLHCNYQDRLKNKIRRLAVLTKVSALVSGLALCVAVALFSTSSYKALGGLALAVSIAAFFCGIGVSTSLKNGKQLLTKITTLKDRLKVNVNNFHDSAIEFEKNVVSNRAFCPGNRGKYIEHNDLRRVDTKFMERFEDFEIDNNLLPEELKAFLDNPTNTEPRFLLYRASEAGGSWLLSRWHAYNQY